MHTKHIPATMVRTGDRVQTCTVVDEATGAERPHLDTVATITDRGHGTGRHLVFTYEGTALRTLHRVATATVQVATN